MGIFINILDMATVTLTDTLNRLLFEHKIRPTELARQTKIPQATIQRLTVGATARPQRVTLETIADFFSITVDQLLGKAPIPGITSVRHKEVELNYKKIPLLSNSDVVDFDKTLLEVNQEIITDAFGGARIFAMRVTDNAMEPVFPENTLLVVDPDMKPRDRNFVIVRLWPHNEIIFRQLVKDGSDLFLKALSSDFQKFEMKKIKEKDSIIGVMIQAKRDYIQNIERSLDDYAESL